MSRSVYDETQWSLRRVVFILLCLWCVFFTAKVIYRLCFHPLAKFPGPKLAAGTFLYEGYYDAVKRGKYWKKIEELHSQYGPIIRINPQELHVHDPTFFDSIYSSSKWDRPRYMTETMDPGFSTFATWDHNHHRLRRGALNRFFSKQKVNSLQHTVQDLAKRLCEKLESYSNTGTPIDFEGAFSNFTLDTISEYMVDSKLGLVDREGFSSEIRDGLRGLAEFGHLHAQMACLGYHAQYRTKEHPTVLREIIADPDLGPSEKTVKRLMFEAKIIMIAGTGTVAWTLATAMFYLTTYPDMLARLRAEILTVMPDPRQPVKYQELEQLPYFNAVLREALRLGLAGTLRSARAAPDRVLQYKNWTIPKNTPVSMSIPHMHRNPENFPDPMRFDPERWLGDIEERRRLEKVWVPFSRGTRGCLGVNLAWAELYIMLSQCVLRMDLELYQTTLEHMEFCSDMFVAEPKIWKVSIPIQKGTTPFSPTKRNNKDSALTYGI
ncbi:hypothetical protein CHU98_g7103 [Xylaria longipes]|nr:hypothetical protein CHU98_g7103 [Xylaria longipes]